jgi:hypothetical protein
MKSASSINAIRQQIATQADVASIRIATLALLRHSLKARKDTLGDWEKAHFSHAITALTLNMHAARQPSYAWLRRCLSDLENAIAPVELRDPNFHASDSSVRDAKYAHLIDAVTSLERELAL